MALPHDPRAMKKAPKLKSKLVIFDMLYGVYKTKTLRRAHEERISGGSGEIRTHERFPVAGFQDRCIQPLCQASVLKFKARL
jgi:hypothetical protein